MIREKGNSLLCIVLVVRGIMSEKTTQRTYPSGTLAANVLGFVNAEGVGSGGLEMALDKRLKGVDGSRTFEQGAAGQAIPAAEDILRAPVPGQGVQLTINRCRWLSQPGYLASSSTTS